MSWQERRCNAEGFGRPEPFFFLCEERTYSPPARRAGGGIPPGGRAVRSSRSVRRTPLQRGQAISRFFKPPSLPVQMAARLTDSFCACIAKALSPYREQPAICLHKPSTGSFAAAMNVA